MANQSPVRDQLDTVAALLTRQLDELTRELVLDPKAKVTEADLETIRSLHSMIVAMLDGSGSRLAWKLEDLGLKEVWPRLIHQVAVIQALYGPQRAE